VPSNERRGKKSGKAIAKHNNRTRNAFMVGQRRRKVEENKKAERFLKQSVT
jgi:hypothetical protein